MSGVTTSSLSLAWRRFHGKESSPSFVSLFHTFVIISLTNGNSMWSTGGWDHPCITRAQDKPFNDLSAEYLRRFQLPGLLTLDAFFRAFISSRLESSMNWTTIVFQISGKRISVDGERHQIQDSRTCYPRRAFNQKTTDGSLIPVGLNAEKQTMNAENILGIACLCLHLFFLSFFSLFQPVSSLFSSQDLVSIGGKEFTSHRI